MGTDIHANLEIALAIEQRQWRTALAAVHLRRDYSLFGLLAGVRTESSGVEALFAPKGLPADASPATMARLALAVDDELAAVECEHACSRAQADAWVASGASRYLDPERSRVFDPDAFALSWLNTEEVALVAATYTERWGAPPTELSAVLAAMQVCDAVGQQARLVIWFRG